jgi:hypothetical protein
MLTCRGRVCAVTIPYLALFPQYLSTNDKTWYNTNVQIFHQLVLNMSVTTAGILSVRRFLTDLQTGKLGVVLNDREIEMTTNSGRSKNRSNDNSKMETSQTSGVFGRSKWGKRDQTPKSHTQSNISTAEEPSDMRLRPDEVARYTTHIIAGGGSSSGTERDARKRKAHAGDGRSDDEISDDKSTSSLKKNGVYQQRDFEMHVEYDYRDGESG